MNTTRPWYVIAFTVLVAAGFTAAVTSVQVATQAKVARNEALFEQRALVKAFGLGDISAMSEAEIATLVEARIDGPQALTDPRTGAAIPVWRAYRTEARKELVGIGFKFEGKGFWDTINGILAVGPDRRKVIGLAVLDQKETPGLGGRIMEASFQERFKGLLVTPPDSAKHQYIYITGATPSGEQDPRYGRTVDAITGATQTCLALEKLLDKDIAAFHRATSAQDGSE